MNGRELTREVGLSKDKVYKWVRRGWLKPERVPAGHWEGYDLAFSAAEVEVAKRMARLVKAGMYPDAAHKVARGSRRAATTLLGAVAPCMGNGELCYRWFGGSE